MLQFPAISPPGKPEPLQSLPQFKEGRVILSGEGVSVGVAGSLFRD